MRDEHGNEGRALFRVRGRIEWTEEREYDCSAGVNLVIAADSEAEAQKRAFGLAKDYSDDEDCVYSRRRGSYVLTGKEPIALISSDDPTLQDMVEESLRRDEARQNLEYMRQYAQPLFVEAA